nr:unnamed protein product [Callosobruchus analis]
MVLSVFPQKRGSFSEKIVFPSLLEQTPIASSILSRKLRKVAVPWGSVCHVRPPGRSRRQRLYSRTTDQPKCTNDCR